MNIEKGKKYIINTNNVCFFNKGDIVVALESSGENCCVPWFIKAETYNALAIKEKNINIGDLIEKYYDDIVALYDDDIIEYQG